MIAGPAGRARRSPGTRPTRRSRGAAWPSWRRERGVRPDRPRARPGPRRRTSTRGSAWRSSTTTRTRSRSCSPTRHGARAVRRRRPRQPALRRVVLDRAAEPWVRERRRSRSRRRSACSPRAPAEVFGITDRGTPRRRASRPTSSCSTRPRSAARQRAGCYDLPAGADRLVADAKGIDAVVVNGTVIRRTGATRSRRTAPLPGRLLRNGRARDRVEALEDLKA